MALVGLDGEELHNEVTLSDAQQAEFVSLMHLRKASDETLQLALATAMDNHRKAGAEYTARVDGAIRSIVTEQLGYVSVEELNKTGRDILITFDEASNKFVARMVDLAPAGAGSNSGETRH